MKYLKNVFGKTAVADAPVVERTDARQAPNNAGGFVYRASAMDRLMRFLILGSEGGTYYVKEQKLAQENAAHVKAMIAENGRTVVKAVVDVSVSGRAPRNDPALFVLAMCASFGDAATRAAALAALPKVARIGTHLFHFVEYVDGMRGWGRGLRTAFGKWYTEQDPKSLAYQVVKYEQRDGWSHADILRKSHPKIEGTVNEILKYVVDGWPGIGEEPHPDEALAIIWAVEKLKTADESETLKLIAQYRLPMEVVPTDKRTAGVYEALLPNTPITWLIRNLGNLSKHGVIAEGLYANLNAVCDKIASPETLRKGRVHPLAVLVALNTYKAGKGVRGSAEWPVIQKVVDALEAAFDLAFKAVEPAGKRFVLGLDVSGSMGFAEIAGMTGITPRIGAAAMALITARTEPNVVSMAFATEFQPFAIGAKESLGSIVKRMEKMQFGGTDCALPMTWALKNRVEADAFVVYTDSETWAGGHPVEALRRYRSKMGIPAKLVVVGMTATEFTIADPEDAGMLDVVGFDTAAPGVISQFVRGAV